MVYIFENLSLCTPQWLEEKKKGLPAWRLKKVQALKKQEDKVRSVAAYLLLERALRERGITSVPEVSYEDGGKPYFCESSLHFSLSHCIGAVACAVGDGPIGVDVQDNMVFSPRLADRICCEEEKAELENARNKGEALTALWTKKEALAKKTGKGLGARFSTLGGEVFTLFRPGYCLSVTEENPEICVIEKL